MYSEFQEHLKHHLGSCLMKIDLELLFFVQYAISYNSPSKNSHTISSLFPLNYSSNKQMTELVNKKLHSYIDFPHKNQQFIDADQYKDGIHTQKGFVQKFRGKHCVILHKVDAKNNRN